MTIELDSTLAQAEVLFLSVRQLVADVDRRKAEEGHKPSNDLRQRRNAQDGSPASIGGPESPVKLNTVEVSEELRELLLTKRS